MKSVDWFDKEPTPADLADIEREWPLIEAELELLDAEITALIAGGKATDMDRRRVRRAQRRVLATRSALDGATVPAAADEAPVPTEAAA